MEHLLPSSINYPPALAIEVAVNELARDAGHEIYSDSDLAKHFEIEPKVLEQLNNNPLFRAEVSQHKQEVKQANISIKRKSSLLLEYYLATWVPDLMSDKSANKDVQFKVVQLLAKMSGIEQSNSSVTALAEAMTNVKQVPQIILNFPPGFTNPMGNVIEHAA